MKPHSTSLLLRFISLASLSSIGVDDTNASLFSIRVSYTRWLILHPVRCSLFTEVIQGVPIIGSNLTLSSSVHSLITGSPSCCMTFDILSGLPNTVCVKDILIIASGISARSIHLAVADTI